MLDRSTAPSFQKIEQVSIQEAQSISLNNGVKLHYIHAGKQEVIRIELVFAAGTIHEANRNTAYLTAKMLGEGTRSYSAQFIHQYIDQFGAFINIENGLDNVVLTVYSLTRFFERVLVILRSIISECSFPEKELNTIKQITLQNLKINLEKNAYLASRNFRTLLYQGTPYERTLEKKFILETEREDIEKHYQDYILASSFDIFISGKVTKKEFNLVNEHLGDIQIKNKPSRTSLEIKNTSFKRKKHYFEKEESLQSSIRIGKSIFQKNHQDYFKFQVLNEVFGGYFGSRLMQNIREDKGFTYGVYSSIVHLRESSYLVISTDVKKVFAQATIDEIYKEAKKLQEEKISESELEKVKNYILGAFVSSVSNAFDLMDLYKGIYFFDLDYGFYDKYIEAISQTTVSDISHLAQKYLDLEDMLVVIVG